MKFRGLQAANVASVVPRAVLDDVRLSLKAKGLFAVLLGAPLGVELRIAWAMDRTRDGREAVTNAWKELLEAGYLVEAKEGLELRENPNAEHVALAISGKLREINDRVTRTYEKAVADIAELGTSAIAGKPEIEVVLPDPEFKGKPRSATVPIAEKRQRVVRPRIVVEKKEEVSSSLDAREDLFGDLSEAQRTKATMFRHSWVGKWARFKPIFASLEAVGVDVKHYFDALMGYSDKRARDHRTCDGWVTSVRDAIERDKKTGKLRRTGLDKEVQHEEASRFLTIGRE